MDFNLNRNSLSIYFIPYSLHAVKIMRVVDFPWIKLECCEPDKRRNEYFSEAVAILRAEGEVTVFGPENRFLGVLLDRLGCMGIFLNVPNLYDGLNLMNVYNIQAKEERLTELVTRFWPFVGLNIALSRSGPNISSSSDTIPPVLNLLSWSAITETDPISADLEGREDP